MINLQDDQRQQVCLTTLFEMGARLATAVSLSELSTQVVAAGCQITHANHGYLLLPDAETGVLSLAAQQGKRPLTTTPQAQQVYSNGEASVLNQRAGECVLAVPLQTVGQTVGVICVERPMLFAADDLDLLAMLANMTAGTLQQLRVNEALARLKRAKSEYVSLVTHEMRLPLTAVKGYVDLMANELVGPLNEQQQEFLVVIQRNVRRMSNLLRDLSQINRLESGQLRLEKRPFALAEVVEAVVGRYQEQLNGRCQTLHLHLPHSLPPVYADPDRVTQILASLLSNAHKYTPTGGHINLTITANSASVDVAIEDTGIGIAEADQPHLFTQFFRANDDLVREQSGWGLGLYLVKKLIETQGGSIGCHSVPGQGTTFTFTLPLGR